MTNIESTAHALRQDDPLVQAVVANIVPGFAEAFPAAIPETVGVIADPRDRFDEAGRGCTAGIGRD